MGESALRSRGGLAYGLDLLDKVTDGLPIKISPWTFVPLDKIKPPRIHAMAADRGRLVLRWSTAGCDEFTHRAKRGDKKRQINAIECTGTVARTNRAIAAARDTMPQDTVGAVLQQYVDLSSGCVFDVEFSSTGVEIEFRTPYGRMLFIRREESEWLEKIGADPRLPNRDEASSVVDQLCTAAARLPATDRGWQFEGAIVPGSHDIWMLQARPTPDDRPRANGILRLDEHLAATHFVWGVFDLEIDLDSGQTTHAEPNDVHLHVRNEPSTEMAPAVLQVLEIGGRAIVLDRTGGFRISHERFNLPDVIARNGYYYAHLPTLHQSRFRVRSDGDTAYFVRI